MITPLRWPENVTAQSFCRDYWQRSPLLVRRAFADVKPPLDRDQLAQLACEADADARLIRGSYPENDWQLESGPFSRDRFESLPKRDWTLLVCGVDTWVDAAANLLGQFRFVPDYRIDDLMVSFAAPGGSVGPHSDQYDVFLIQGEGSHRWQIGSPGEPECLPDLPVKVLKSFTPTAEWELQPGDMLYLPPGVPHYGVAGQAGMTLSVGFRAPTQAELLARMCRSLALQTTDAPAATDARPVYTNDPACLTDRAMAPMLETLKATLQDEQALRRALAAALSRSGNHGADPVGLSEHWIEDMHQGRCLRRSPEVQALYLRQGGQAELFVQGEIFSLPLGLVRLLCDSPGSHPPESRTGQRPALGFSQLKPWLHRDDTARVVAELIRIGLLEWIDPP